MLKVEGLVEYVVVVEVDVLVAADIVVSAANQMVLVTFQIAGDLPLLKAAVLRAQDEPLQSPACLVGPAHWFVPLLKYSPAVAAFHPCFHSYSQLKPSSHLQSFQVGMFCSPAVTILNPYLP